MPPLARRVVRSSQCLYCRVLIGAWNPMLCQIHVFRSERFSQILAQTKLHPSTKEKKTKNLMKRITQSTEFLGHLQVRTGRRGGGGYSTVSHCLYHTRNQFNPTNIAQPPNLHLFFFFFFFFFLSYFPLFLFLLRPLNLHPFFFFLSCSCSWYAASVSGRLVCCCR